MSAPQTEQIRRHRPFVPENMKMREFTWRAVVLGLVMCVILGAANAYLALRAGQTIAATYPAAVIGMAVLRLGKGTILEENIARTAGSIGESVAAGAVFTLPAFFLARVWMPPVISKNLSSWERLKALALDPNYLKSTALLLVGSVLGVLFISLIRRVLVEDPELPFPESLAASEIHKAGQRGAEAAKYLFWNIGLGGLVYLLGRFSLYATDARFALPIGQLGASRVRVGGAATRNVVSTGGITSLAAPSVSPAFLGVGYIIGPKLASLLFSGGVISWGFLVPALIYFLGPQLKTFLPANATAGDWMDLSAAVWRYIVRPIAVGGMLVGAAYTLFRMRTNLASGLKRAMRDTGQAVNAPPVGRTERYMSSKVVFALIGVVFAAMIALYIYFSGQVLGGIVAAAVMLVLGFFFATVSGSLCGIIGS